MRYHKEQMKRSPWRPIAVVTVLIVTVTVFVYYFIKHPAVRQQLRHTSPEVLLTLLALYLCSIIALALITVATLRLCQVRLKSSESLLVTMYSAIINFFGPLQSGPAFRAVYLKKKHGLNLKNYAVATLVYYFFYGAYSGALLVSGLLKWWLLPLALLGLGIAYLVAQTKRLKPRLQNLDLRGWYYLAAATLLQVTIIILIYYVELRSVDPSVRFSQALIYTGAANLAMFVSLTPGAVGFRESFLVLSRHLHHLSNSVIVSANILDRALYLVLLLILAVLIFTTHAREQLGIKPKAPGEQ
jgi:uncharacterized membrane protein YbhN (UPF0104 family)